MKIYDQHSNHIAPPEGVDYTGSRGVGCFLALRFINPVTHEYVDRFYNNQGVEMFRESGLTPTPSFWSRLFP